MRPRHLIALLVLLMLAAPAAPAHAGGIVSVCDEAHLKAALAGAGAVTFSCSGTITLTSTIEISAYTTIDGSGQNVTISGNHTVGVFIVGLGFALHLNALTIADGLASNGGGILNSGWVTVSNSTFSGNSAIYGGGIYTYKTSELTVSNSMFSGNSATTDGGGIYIQKKNFGSGTVTNSTFSGNSAPHGGGGGIYDSGGELTVSNSTFSGNSAADGGGIFSGGDELTVSNSTFSGNSAPTGGGLYTHGAKISHSTFSSNSATSGGGIYSTGSNTISNSTFYGNSATSGGGIHSSYGSMTVTNSTFYGNSATDGGGIHSFYGSLTVTNSTFSNNSAANGGGIGIPIGGDLTLKNTIVANSPSGGNCSGWKYDGGGNLSYPDTTCPGINSDPVLGPLQDNGGPTQTMALLPGSAALDAARDYICSREPVNNRDQRGIARPQGTHCDIGAYEALPRRAFLPIMMR